MASKYITLDDLAGIERTTVADIRTRLRLSGATLTRDDQNVPAITRDDARRAGMLPPLTGKRPPAATEPAPASPTVASMSSAPKGKTFIASVTTYQNQ